MTPLKYLNRIWLRRTIIVVIAPFTLLIYLGTGVKKWARILTKFGDENG